LCRRHSLPFTAQRRVVLKDLSSRADHPTADQVYLRASKALPEISRTTVYRVLETFVRVGIVRKVCHPGASARYEMEMRRHHHLVCLECESIVDLEDVSLDQLRLPEVRSGFRIEDYSIQFRGLCADCAKKTARRHNPQ
jgi:Fur family peroxide stress response transcriptional regulator